MWMSKAVRAPSQRKAHFVLDDGAPLCSKLFRPDGSPLRAPFKRGFEALDPQDRRCTHCECALPHHLAGRPLPTF